MAERREEMNPLNDKEIWMLNNIRTFKTFRPTKSRWEIILDKIFLGIILFALFYGFFMLGRWYESSGVNF
jgi:hypothetical protein